LTLVVYPYFVGSLALEAAIAVVVIAGVTLASRLGF